MDDTVFVGVLESIAELRAQVHDFFPAHPAPASHHLVEGFSLDVFHRVVGGVLVLADAEEAEEAFESLYEILHYRWQPASVIGSDAGE